MGWMAWLPSNLEMTKGVLRPFCNRVQNLTRYRRERQRGLRYQDVRLS